MKSILILAALAVAGAVYAEESALERAARKTGEFLERGGKKVSPALDRAGKGIELGARAAGRGVDRGATATQKGAEKIHGKIDEKVRPQQK
jgi:hypothetical protein